MYMKTHMDCKPREMKIFIQQIKQIKKRLFRPLLAIEFRSWEAYARKFQYS